uniref:Core shell protein Gag P30 domain-containing protein n=1 Tax=Crocodylus porosus TaxID=8502 RepID=A0A7M4FZJ8_CROPO
MGQSSKCPGDAPLSLILKDWKDISGTAGLSKAKMRNLCWIQWPSFTSHLSPAGDWLECGTFSTERMNFLQDILVDIKPGKMNYLYACYNYKPTEGQVAFEAVCMDDSCKNPPPYALEPHREEDEFVPILPPVRWSERVVPSPLRTPASPLETWLEGTPKTHPVIQAPLRTYPVLMVAGGHQMVFTRTPFATSDLLNWQRTMPRLRDNPEAVERMFRTIFSTQMPTWADVNQLLNTLMTEDERQKVKEKATAYLTARNCSLNDWPTADPNWDPNIWAQKLDLDRFLEAVLNGIKEAGEATPIWSKVTACVQCSDEHPSDFCTRLTCEIRKLGCLDPDSDHGKAMIKMVFMSQCAEDIAKRFREHPDSMQGKNLPEDN